MAKRTLHYVGACQHFMQNLIQSGKTDTAWAIKSHLLELCEFGQSFAYLTKKGDTPNLFISNCKAAPTDDPNHSGFCLETLILEKGVIVVSITKNPTEKSNL